MLRDCRPRHWELGRDLTCRTFPPPHQCQDATARYIRKSAQNSIHGLIVSESLRRNQLTNNRALSKPLKEMKNRVQHIAAKTADLLRWDGPIGYPRVYRRVQWSPRVASTCVAADFESLYLICMIARSTNASILQATSIRGG